MARRRTMVRTAIAVLTSLWVLASVSGCGGSTTSQGEQEQQPRQDVSTTQQQQQQQQTTTTVEQTSAALAADEFELTGDVERPAKLTVAELQGLPVNTVDATYESQGKEESHTYRGALLYDLLDRAGLKLNPNQKNAQLRKYVLVSAKDGYGAVVSWGEIDPGFANAQILLAWEEDGKELAEEEAGPVRLVVPTDKRGGRYVSGVVKVEVRSAAAGGSSS